MKPGDKVYYPARRWKLSVASVDGNMVELYNEASQRMWIRADKLKVLERWNARHQTNEA